MNKYYANDIIKWLFGLVGYFNHYGFFTKKLWKNVEGFEEEDEANVKNAFMHYWFHHQYGYFTAPRGMSWYAETDEEGYNLFIERYKPVIDAFEEWVKAQR